MQFVRYELRDRVAVVTIDRPQALNALNAQVIAELHQALDRAAGDPGARACVLTGTGRAFVAGADIAALAAMSPLESRDFARVGQALMTKLSAMALPVIAAVNGFALGGGCELALACDFIYAGQSAKFGQPEINLGFNPFLGGTQRLARRVGTARALEMCLGGAMIDAERALAIGLVNQVAPDAELMERALQAAGLMASKGRQALAAVKALIHGGQDMPLERAVATEAEHFAACLSSPDAAEGMAAFLEKRPAKFI